MNKAPTSSKSLSRLSSKLAGLARSLEAFAVLRPFGWACLVLAALFALPLYRLGSYALENDLYSHVPLIPFVAAYLMWQRKDRLAAAASSAPPPRLWASIPLLAGAAALAAYGMGEPSAWHVEDRLAAQVFPLVAFVWAAALALLDRSALRPLAFPLAFLVLLVPFPVAIRAGLETFLQHASGEASYGLFKLIGTPIYREGLLFQLPNINLEVAPQCSGIRSSLVLFIVSLVAGDLFLKSPWKRVLLALFVAPVAIIRNALRITVIGQVCVVYGSHMINSWVHHSGGPYFFALSLAPFFLVLFLLWRSDRRPLPLAGA